MISDSSGALCEEKEVGERGRFSKSSLEVIAYDDFERYIEADGVGAPALSNLVLGLLFVRLCRLLRQDAGPAEVEMGDVGRGPGADVPCVGVVRPPNLPMMSSTLDMLALPGTRWPGAHVVRLFRIDVTPSSCAVAGACLFNPCSVGARGSPAILLIDCIDPVRDRYFD